MSDLSRSSCLHEDPLLAYSGLSLFPRTLKSLSIPLPSPLYQSEDLHHTHTLLDSMPFDIQKEHQEQAIATMDDNSKQVIGTSVESEDVIAGAKMNPIQKKRERRPGLDRKRAQFSFKPMTIQPATDGPTFDGSKYPRPDEYFDAYDRFKNAKREWDKELGISVTDTHRNQPSRRQRPRRPGIPGRKRSLYTHTFTDSYLTDDICLETSEKENHIPSEQSLEKTTAASSTADKEVDDTDENLENILSGLLACDKDELEGDGAVKLLEERLKIKPFDLSKFTIPEFQDVREMRLKAYGRNPLNRKSVLSNIQNMLKGSTGDAVRKNKQSSSSNPPVDQFSFPDSDNLLPGDQQSGMVDLAKDLNVCSSSPVTKDTVKGITITSPPNVDTVYVASPFNSSVQKSSNEENTDTHSGNHNSHSTPDGNADNCVNDIIINRNSATSEVNVDVQTKGNEVDVPVSESEANRDTSRRENNADINEETDKLDILAKYASREAARMDPFTVEEDSIPYQQDESSKSPNKTPEQCNSIKGSFDHAENIQEPDQGVNDNIDTSCGLQVENVQEVHYSSQEQAKKRRRGSCDSNKKKRSKTVPSDSEGAKQLKTSSHESGAKKQTKRKSNEREEKQMKKVTREGKLFSRRKSLAAAGTKWESGVRRSTRIKSRPLEYWRGERFLIGRIHESLATVIGIKYASPDKYASKVKSFVSDDHKEMVDLAALH